MENNNEQFSQIIFKALKNPEFKKKLLQKPKETIESELKIKIPNHIKIVVMEETESKKYLILPHLSETELEEKELKSISAGVKSQIPRKRRASAPAPDDSSDE